MANYSVQGRGPVAADGVKKLLYDLQLDLRCHRNNLSQWHGSNSRQHDARFRPRCQTNVAASSQTNGAVKQQPANVSSCCCIQISNALTTVNVLLHHGLNLLYQTHTMRK